MDIRRFLAELKGRGVYRVAAFYAAGSWALLQVADIFFPILGFPDWAITSVLVIAALGFPVAIMLSWVFEITPEGIVETNAAGVNFGRLRLSPARLVELGLLVALVSAVGWLYVERLTLKEQASAVASPVVNGRPSVAVLAFENMSDDQELEYFGDGLSEEILNLLAKISELNVASRTSSFYFKGKDIDIQEIGRRLGVAHVLEGSVRRANGRVRVTAQLIEVEGGFHLWSSTYDRNFEDVFLIQDDIARQVVDNLEVLLSASSQEILDRRPTLVPEAYDYYLRGIDYLRETRNESNAEQAIALFTRAIELDSNYAEAFAGICNAELFLYSARLDPKLFESAQGNCQRALKIDHTALPVYVALGNLYRASGEYGQAIAEFNKALSINPVSIDALIGLGETYALDNKPGLAEEALLRATLVVTKDSRSYHAMGRFLFRAGRIYEAIPYFESITELTPDNAQAFASLSATYALSNQFEKAAEASRRSLELAPSAFAYSNLGSNLFFLGRFKEAVDMYQKAVEYAPDHFEYWGNLGDAYRFTDSMQELAVPMYTNAIKLASASLEVNPSDPSTLSLVGHYHASIGNRENALQYIARATALAPDDMYVYYFAATALCSLGELEQAMASLEKALDLGYSAELVSVDPGLGPLKGLEGFETMLTSNY